jgi:hypothetical protein
LQVFFKVFHVALVVGNARDGGLPDMR